MACTSCGKSPALVNNQPSQPTQTIVQFLEANGWQYNSHCGCSNNMTNYLNPSFPDYMISANGMRLEVKKILAAYAKDYKVLAVAGNSNYEHIYRMFIPEKT